MIKPPATLQSWLDYPTSITDKLKTYHANVHLKLLEQQWAHQDEWEKCHTPIEVQAIFRREILMYADQHPCWFARTMIPKTTYQHENARFERLKTESLGDIIWQSNDIHRSQLWQFALEKNTYLYQHIATHLSELELSPPYLWGRLSTFIIQEQLPFYLLEIFLPDLYERYTSPHSLP